MPAAGENGRIGRIGPVFRRSGGRRSSFRAFRAAGVTGEIRTSHGRRAAPERGRKGPERRRMGPVCARSVEKKARSVEEMDQNVEGSGRLGRARLGGTQTSIYRRSLADFQSRRRPGAVRAPEKRSRFFNAPADRQAMSAAARCSHRRSERVRRARPLARNVAQGSSPAPPRRSILAMSRAWASIASAISSRGANAP